MQGCLQAMMPKNTLSIQCFKFHMRLYGLLNVFKSPSYMFLWFKSFICFVLLICKVSKRVWPTMWGANRPWFGNVLYVFLSKK
jgi:hypothetical protein